ncbi:MAG: ABC transporter ATP-binding protein [Solirubrobacteraceae bacterium]
MAEPPASVALLEIQALRVRYGPVPVVHGLDLVVPEGSIIGLIGPNGAGKSTTLLSIMGAVRSWDGDIRLRGRSLRGRRTEEIARSGIALVPEGRHVFADLTVGENLSLGLTARRGRAGADEDRERIEALFPVVAEHRDRPAGALSGGQQQQLVIARALLASPDLLMLDEPSLGLAPAVVDDLFATLERIRLDGVTVLIVEQRAQITVGMADRTYVLSSGELRGTLTPADAGDTERMVAAYFGS